MTRVKTYDFKWTLTCALSFVASNDPIFLFDYNDVRAFEVFKWTTGCIFKCETMMLSQNVKNWFLSKNSFVVFLNVFLNTSVI